MLRFRIDRIRKNKTLKNGFLFTFFNFMSTGVNFILLVVLSKFLSPDEYGYLNLFNTFVTFMSIFISFNTEKIIVVDYFRVTRQYTSETITSLSMFSFGLLFLYSLLVIGFRNLLEKELGFSIIFLIIAIFYCFLDKLSGYNKAIWKAEANAKAFGLYTFLIVTANCIGTIFCLVSFQMGWSSRVVAQFLVSFIFGVVSLILLWKRQIISCNVKLHVENLKKSLQFGLPMVPNTLSWWAMQGVNRFIINSYYGPTEVGLYSFATNFSNIIQIIASSFAQSWHVDVFQRLTLKEEGYVDYLSRFTRKMILIYALVAIIVYLGCSAIIPFFFSNYIASLKFLFPLCLGAFAHSVGTLFDCYILYYKKTKILMGITLVASTINVLMGAFFIRYNLLMAAYISMISEIFITFMYIFYSSKYVPFFINRRK